MTYILDMIPKAEKAKKEQGEYAQFEKDIYCAIDKIIKDDLLSINVEVPDSITDLRMFTDKLKEKGYTVIIKRDRTHSNFEFVNTTRNQEDERRYLDYEKFIKGCYPERCKTTMLIRLEVQQNADNF